MARTENEIVSKSQTETMHRTCENISCNGRAVAQEITSGVWLCQSCLDYLYDALWGIGP